MANGRLFTENWYGWNKSPYPKQFINTLQYLNTMASNPDFVQFIADQCAKAGDITTRKMFGDYAIYCNGKIFGLICDNNFYVKPTEAGRRLLRSENMRPPYDGAKPYFYIEEVDDHDYLTALVKATCSELPDPKPKNKTKKK